MKGQGHLGVSVLHKAASRMLYQVDQRAERAMLLLETPKSRIRRQGGVCWAGEAGMARRLSCTRPSRRSSPLGFTSGASQNRAWPLKISNSTMEPKPTMARLQRQGGRAGGITGSTTDTPRGGLGAGPARSKAAEVPPCYWTVMHVLPLQAPKRQPSLTGRSGAQPQG